jgi:prolyl-tRNA synthetase
MLQSKLFTKTIKDAPKDEVSLNAQLLIRGGFIDKLTAGIYSYLPLGLRTLKKIQEIVREEMNAIDGQEILMPALTPKENWDVTERWDKIDVLFKLKSQTEKEYALGATHEEIVTPLVKKFVNSYKDLPVAVYQIQDKFRDELRAKSGILRGREFNMKDLYSFHANEEDFKSYYEKSKKAYLNIYKRCGLDAKIVEADGGVFSKFSHEFQVFTQFGEDTIKYCSSCGFAQNSEICDLKEGDNCPNCEGKIKDEKAIEVGNIFPLKTRFPDAFEFKYIDDKGKQQDVTMGCYGIGPSRMMGSIVEVHHDDNGIVWPEAVAPYKVHLLALGNDDKVMEESAKLYAQLEKAGVEVLYDDRDDSAGVKFSDSDLLGLPYRIVVSKKTLAENQVELKKRSEEKASFVELNKIIDLLK